jgi:hypothetical protein
VKDRVTHMLRGTHGQHAGSLFVIVGPMMIGRAPHAEIQILEESVSRQHARLTVEHDGTVKLVDLMSASGTRVAGRPVNQAQLRPGETIQIGSARFVYERRVGQWITSPSFIAKTTSLQALHRTRPGVNAAAPNSGPPSLSEARSARIVTPSGAPVSSSASVAAPRIQPTAHMGAPRMPLTMSSAELEPDEGPQLPTLESCDGVLELVSLFSDHSVSNAAPTPVPIEGDSGRFSLREDVAGSPSTNGGSEGHVRIERLLHYHALAQRMTVQAAMAPEQARLLAALEAEFRGDAHLSHNRRGWKRFDLDASATAVVYRNLHSTSVTVRVQDIGAAGIKFESREVVFAKGDPVSLLVNVHREGPRRQAVFTGRIMWVSPTGDLCGAMFVGPGSWQSR